MVMVWVRVGVGVCMRRLFFAVGTGLRFLLVMVMRLMMVLLRVCVVAVGRR